MFRTLLVAGIAAFVGKKLYDKGVLDPYIAEARKQLKTVLPETDSDMAGEHGEAGAPSSFTPPPHVVPVS